MDKKFGALSSSVDSQSLAKTVEGAIIASAGIIALLLGYFDLPVSIEQITSSAANIGITIGTLVTFYGLVRKAVVKFAQR